MRAGSAIALLLAAVLCACSAGNDDLDIESATTVLATQIGAARPFFRFVDHMANADDVAENGVYRTLVRAGILETFRAQSLFASSVQTHYRLTAKGRALAADWRKEERGVYEIPVGRLRLVRVKSVEMLAPRHAMVTYVYAIDLNAMGQLLYRASGQRLNYLDPLESRLRDIHAGTQPTSESAEMRLYENGWKNENWTP